MDEDNDLDWKPNRNFGGAGLALLLPIATAGVALVVGLTIGGIATRVLFPSIQEREVVQLRDYTAAELETACAPLVKKAIEQLDEAEKKVDELKTEVDAKVARIRTLEKRAVANAEAGRRVMAELKMLREQVADLEEKLEVAEAEKAELEAELTQTEVQLEKTEKVLEETKFELKITKKDAQDAKWTGFVQNAQLNICERGNRKKLGRCRETVDEKVKRFEDTFRMCIATKQAAPTVVEATKEMRKTNDLPEFAEWIDNDDRVTRDWYVLLCDPTLPEARAVLDDLRDEPATKPTTRSSSDDDFEFEDLDGFE